MFLAGFAYPSFVHINKALLDILNAKNVTSRHWIDFLSAGESNPRAVRSFLNADLARDKLREYVGAWIDSGFQDDGSEEPECRTYKTWGCQAIFETLASVLSCSHAIPAEGVFALNASRQAPTPYTGYLSAWFNPGGGVELVPEILPGTLSEEQLAAWGFYLFWKAALLFTLMRCARCGVFAIPGRKPRRRYLRGWHCERCRNTAHALAATKDAREKRKCTWLKLAVDAYLDFYQHPRRSKRDRTLFIVEKVNASMPIYQRIKRHTITHNMSEIEAEVGRRKPNA